MAKRSSARLAQAAVSLLLLATVLVTSPGDVASQTVKVKDVFTPSSTDDLKWWQTGIVYQVYPRSFKDTDGDGIGDLKGVLSKLDYLHSLGVTAIWLSPFFKSPMADMGYDISDYREVDPLFGNIGQFDQLVAQAHAKGLKIIIDFVPGHTSVQHEWFEKSEKKEEPYTDYYVWSDGKMTTAGNGKQRQPPNNWLSVFGGSAWKWSDRRQQYFYHAFLDTQANLNFKNDKLKEEMKNVIRYWLDKGVDGLRVDAISHICQVDDLSLDEPSAGNDLSDFNYNSQQHIYQENRPEMYPIIQSWVQILDEYEKRDGRSRYMILETYSGFDVRTKMFATGANPFNFDLTWANKPITGYQVRDKIVNEYNNLPAGKWPNFVLGNHDVRRVSEKFGSDHVDVFNMLLLTLWGTPTTYYGEEIGMVPPDISWEQTVDPWGKNYGKDRYREFTRDFQRSPMQWDNSTMAGFTDGRSSWLPVAKTYSTVNVKTEEDATTNTPLKLYRRLAKIRGIQAFKEGSLKIALATANVISYLREGDPSRFLVALNVGDKPETNSFYQVARVGWGNVVAATSKSSKAIHSTLPTYSLTLLPGEGVVILLTPLGQ